MVLSSVSTLDQIKAAYDDSADYDVSNDIAKARTFVQACRMLKRRTLTSMEQTGSGGYQDDYRKLSEEEQQAVQWLTANDPTYKPPITAGRTTGIDFTNFRGNGSVDG